jgi:hypothetical protein
MSSHRAKHGEQTPINKIFSKRFVRIGDCARITFTTTLKIAGKYDFFKFCKPYISSKSHPTQQILYIQTLGGSLYKLAKFEDISSGGYPSPLKRSVSMRIGGAISYHTCINKLKCSLQSYLKKTAQSCMNYCKKLKRLWEI